MKIDIMIMELKVIANYVFLGVQNVRILKIIAHNVTVNIEVLKYLNVIVLLGIILWV